MRGLVLKVSLAALACVLVGAGFVACDRKQTGQQTATPPYNMASNTGPGTPQPYLSSRPNQPGSNQTGWPTVNGQPPAMPAIPSPNVAPGLTGANGPAQITQTQAIQMPPPQGMTAVASPAGRVFIGSVDGTQSALQMAQGTLSSIGSYFGAPLNATAQQADPQDYMAQVAFSTTLNGAQVMGMISAIVDHQGGGHVYVLFDDARNVQQSMPAMMYTVQQTEMGIWSRSQQQRVAQ